MKGVYKLRTPKPKYNSIWDVKPLLNYLKAMEEGDLYSLTLKCSMLLALTTGQRIQTLTNLSLDFLVKSSGKFTFHIAKILKTSKPGKHFSVEVKQYSRDPKLCPYNCLTKYLLMTENLRTSDQLFITHQKPHTPASSHSISRWIRTVLSDAGVETKFGAHSTRHASTSKAFNSTIPIDQILDKAGWTSDSTFANFHRKPIAEDNSFAESVLNQD